MCVPVTTASGKRASTSACGASSGSWWTLMLWPSVVVGSAETRAPKVVYRPRRTDPSPAHAPCRERSSAALRRRGQPIELTAATPESGRSHQRAERVVLLGFGPPPLAEEGRRDLVALDDEVDAQRELPHSLGKREEEADRGRLLPGAEEHGGGRH